ncbi:MAG TPA: ATP-binding protein [Polyangiaceae bacterium]|jgi:signal transduction histidine kinase|nr:ATP-binding protein [Polyangiaceae bacterium]
MSKLFAQLAEVAAAAQRARTVQGVLETAGTGLWNAGLRLGVLQITSGVGEARYACDPDGLLKGIESIIGRPITGLTGPLDPNAPALQALGQGMPIYVEDLSAVALAFLQRRGDVDRDAVDRALRQAGMQRGVVLPVVVRGAPWGVIVVFSPELIAEDVAALGLFGAQLGSAIETADTIETLERRSRELAAIHSIATASSSQGLELLAKELLEIAAQATASDYGVIYLVDESRAALIRIGSPFGYSDAALAERYERLSLDTHTGRAALMQEPVAIPVSELGADIGDDLASHGFREFCLAPLKLQGRPAGALNLVRAEPRPYSRDDLRFAEILAGQVGIQLENARLNAEEKLRVAELRASYQRLEHTQEELVRHEKLAALGELAAAMAHELRNPLGAIFNSLGSLKKITPKNSDAALFETIITEEADRVNRIVGDLLDFARPYKPVLKPASIEAIVVSALEATAQIGHDANVAIETSFAPEVPEVFVDARILRQALINLLVNAIQATPRGGHVTVDVSAATNVVHIDISDEGGGVSPDISARIFEPFFTTKPTGTGLGLAVVKRIMEAHGGVVELGDERTRGATFRITLPAGHSE